MLEPQWNPHPDKVARYLNQMILSPSGWRAIFSADGDEESHSRRTRPEYLVLVGLATRVFVEALRKIAADKINGPTSGESAQNEHSAGAVNIRIAVGEDTRPTGPLLAQAAIRALLAEGIEPEYLFAVASPEIMAFTRSTENVSGFLYISASHNPIGYNGLKLGLDNGSVATGAFNTSLVRRFRTVASDTGELARTTKMLRRTDLASESEVYSRSAERKRMAADCYRALSNEVIRGPGRQAGEAFSRLEDVLHTVRPGIVADMNGSARSISIDRALLTEMGCRLQTINETPGEMMHQIVPEGAGLAECVALLSATSKSDPGYILGYVPDNDGDRGNLVICDSPGRARPLEAQEVFSLCAVAELSWLYYNGAVNPDLRRGSPRLAIVVNGPTSMRIETIARLLGAEVHRAEVGEANVVGRARELRDAGYMVHFFGEGSNGGNITHPSAVRDPLHTIFAVLKLLYAPSWGGRLGPGRFWLHLVGRERPLQAGIANDSTKVPLTLIQILDSLPRYTTTSASDPMAKMQVACTDHGLLKNEVERIWEAKWPRLKKVRSALGATGYRYENYEGTVCRPGRGNRTGRAKGGFKIILIDDDDQPRAFLWMRGSGTEPVFRVIVDVQGDMPGTERTLLRILREMVTEADDKATAKAG